MIENENLEEGGDESDEEEENEFEDQIEGIIKFTFREIDKEENDLEMEEEE